MHKDEGGRTKARSRLQVGLGLLEKQASGCAKTLIVAYNNQTPRHALPQERVSLNIMTCICAKSLELT
jgi:hypothetical protein